MLSISLPRIFEGQGSGYPPRVSKVNLKWTGSVKVLTKGQLGSNLMVTLPHISFPSGLPACSVYIVQDFLSLVIESRFGCALGFLAMVAASYPESLANWISKGEITF